MTIAAPTTLQRLARAAPRAAPSAAERCELCAAPIDVEHRHLLDVHARRLGCACRACGTLFDRAEAGGKHYRLVPDRLWYLEECGRDDALWARTGMPVGLGFLVRSTSLATVLACFPSPAGPTESPIDGAAWDALVADHAGLAQIEPDVEALLVNRVRGARDHWLAPLDVCVGLVGLVRTHWRGFSGGGELQRRLDDYFAQLRARAVRVARDGTRVSRREDRHASAT